MSNKVGILSMQKVVNYGSYLQAYALKQMLVFAGAESVDFIDIIPGKNLIRYNSKESKFKRSLKSLISLIKTRSLCKEIRSRRFGNKIGESIVKDWPNIGIGKDTSNKNFDLVVIGSDEVFNCCQDSWFGYSTQLFGNVSQARKIISYAGSFGHTNYSDLINFNIDKEIAYYLQRLDAISVRDENSKSIIKKLTGRDSYVHLDPVLAYGFKSEIKNMMEAPIDGSYMVVYTYNNRIKSPTEISAIRNFANKNGLKIICVFGYYDWCDECIIPSSNIDVLRWFKFAKAVATDTFHGTIFSIITHCNFVTFIRPSNRNKLHGLLEILNLTSREVENINDFSKIISSTPDYKSIDENLEIRRKETVRYLSKELKDL